MAKSIHVKLLGEKITLKTHAEDGEVADQALQLVSERVAQAELKAHGRLPQNQVLLLTLLELAAEHIKTKKRIDQFFSELDQKLEDIVGNQSKTQDQQSPSRQYSTADSEPTAEI